MDEDKLILYGAIAVGSYFLLSKFMNPDQVDAGEARNLVANAAIAGNRSTWYAPLQGKQAILDEGNTNTTYFIDEKDINAMPRWQRILFSWGVSPKTLFGGMI